MDFLPTTYWSNIVFNCFLSIVAVPCPGMLNDQAVSQDVG